MPVPDPELSDGVESVLEADVVPFSSDDNIEDDSEGVDGGRAAGVAIGVVVTICV